MSATNVITSQKFDNAFSWQVGYHTTQSTSEPLQFRATVRPVTNNEAYNRVPNSVVLYEETGIILNGSDNLGRWQFPLSINSAIAGGPYRSYQLVIESHDANGNTSAGNLVGTSDENGWSAYPFGYDMIVMDNPRPSGIEMSNNLATTNYFTGGTYYSLTTGSSDRKFAFSGTSSLFPRFEGTGLFSGSGVFTGTYIITTFNFTENGISYNQNFSGLSIFTGYGSFYSGNVFLGNDVTISGTSRFTGVYKFIDTGVISEVNSGAYSSRNYMNGDGGVSIQFLDGDYDSDIKGGYIYVYSGRFPKLDAAIGIGTYGNVQKTKFSFDPVYKFISHPSAASNFRGAPYVYASVSFYDALDELSLNNDSNLDISTGLYISNNAILYNDTAPGTTSIGGIGTILSARYNGDISSLSLTDSLVVSIIGTGNKAIAITSDGVTSVIYYVSTPITTSPYGGTMGGNATTSGAGGGAGGGAVSDGGSSSIGLGIVRFTPGSTDFGGTVNVTMAVSGSANRIHYKAGTSTTAPSSYSTYVGTGKTVVISATNRLWGRASDGTNNSAWDYRDYTKSL